MFMCQSIRQCSAYGKHPAVRVLVSPDGHVTSGSNVTNACIHSEACMMDLTWALVRMPPLKLFGVDLFPSEKQRVPGWIGFNAVVHSCVPVLTNIGYCPDRRLSNRVLAKECHRVMHILPECVHSAELYWEPSISF